MKGDWRLLIVCYMHVDSKAVHGELISLRKETRPLHSVGSRPCRMARVPSHLPKSTCVLKSPRLDFREVRRKGRYYVPGSIWIGRATSCQGKVP